MLFDVIQQITHFWKKKSQGTSTILWEKSLIDFSLHCANWKREGQMLDGAYPSTQLSKQKRVESPFITIEHKFFLINEC